MSGYNPPIIIPAGTGTGTGTGTSVDIDEVSSVYEAVIAATDYVVGDQLQRIRFYNSSTQAAAGEVWYNLTQGKVITAAPPAANVNPTSTVLLNHLGKNSDAAAPVAGTGNYSLIGGIKRLVLATVDLLSRIPVLSNGRVPVSVDPVWVTVEYRTNASYYVVFEKEFDGTNYRQRTWAATTDAQGVTSYVAGAWA
jgi:hypothetical protein